MESFFQLAGEAAGAAGGVWMDELNEIRLPREVEEFRLEPHLEHFRVVALGDSITENGSMRREDRWTSHLQELIGDQAVVVNAGIGGTSSNLGLFRWRRDVSPIGPHVVLINFLLNDSHIRFYECSTSYLVQCTAQRMRANLVNMIYLSRIQGAVPVIWTPPPVPTWSRPDRRMSIQLDLLEDYHEVLVKAASEEGVAVVDLWETFPGLVEEFPGDYFRQPDGYHSTEKAQPIIASQIWQAIGPIFSDWDGSRQSG